MMDDCCTKRVQETFVVEASSFADAEARATKEYGHNDELFIIDIKRAKYGEIFFTDNDKDERFYRIKVAIQTIDERTGKVKENSIFYLTQSDTFDNAKDNVHGVFSDTFFDYVIKTISETKITEVYEYNTNENANG